MENFPTPPKALLPWVANLATLAVVLSAAWWSSGHRPLSSPSDSRLAAPTQPYLQPATVPAATTSPGNPSTWPAQTTSLPADNFISVGFSAPSRR